MSLMQSSLLVGKKQKERKNVGYYGHYKKVPKKSKSCCWKPLNLCGGCSGKKSKKFDDSYFYYSQTETENCAATASPKF